MTPYLVSFLLFMEVLYIWNLYWVANYSDGTKLSQFEDDPVSYGKKKENKYADIDRERLVRFDMVDKDINKAVYSLYLNEGKKLIFRRRTLLKPTIERVVIFIVGYQQTFMTNSGVRSYVVLNYLHPNKTIALDDDRNNLELLDFEH